jgi:hypothetical protein
MKRELSERSLSLLFLTRLIGGVLGTLVALVLLPRLSPAVGNSQVLIATFLWTFMMTLLIRKDWRLWHQLKKVALDERFLYVSDYADTEPLVIPLQDIRRVMQWRGRALRTVTVHLRTPSLCGGRIQFQPLTETGEWGWAWEENRVVHELRNAVRKQTATVS